MGTKGGAQRRRSRPSTLACTRCQRDGGASFARGPCAGGADVGVGNPNPNPNPNQIKLPTSHFAKFTGGWLVLPEHTAAHGKLLELLRQRSVVLGRLGLGLGLGLGLANLSLYPLP